MKKMKSDSRAYSKGLQGILINPKPRIMRWTLLIVLLMYILLSGRNYYSNELLEKKIENNAFYLYDAQQKLLVPKSVDEQWINGYDTRTALAFGILELLSKNEENGYEKATLPRELSLLTIRVDQKHVILNFGKSISTLSAFDELIAKAAIIKSLTSFDAFDSVEFFMNGVPIKQDQQYISGKFYTNDILISYEDVVNRVFSTAVTLYMPSDKKNKLRQVYQEILVSPNKKVEEVIVETIIMNSEEPVFPKNTKLLNVYINKEVCFVDLSNECQTNLLPLGISERIAVYSIVNSLVDLPNVTQVQFLIEGEIVKTLQGNLSLDRLLTKNYALIDSDYTSQIRSKGDLCLVKQKT